MTGRFVVERCLGEGSMGAVYLAYDRARGTKVALKTLRRVDASGIYRFKREFRALADVSHPNLVELHELFSEGSDWFFTMEYVEGQDFLTYVLGPGYHTTDMSGRSTRELRPLRGQDGTLPPSPLKEPERLCDVLRQVATAVCALHAAGKLHRDLKPDNVLVTADGRAVVLDFGISAERHIDPHGTMEGGVMGTPAYMSPEQARSSAVSEATDWYAFGTMLFEGLTGQVPFDGSYKELLEQKQTLDPHAPSQIVSGVPAALDALCVRLLARDPQERPTGAEVLAALGSPTGASVSARPPAEQTAPFVGRNHELTEIDRALSVTDEGSPVLLFVHGATGMGKSALVERFLYRLDRSQTVVLSGRCYEHEMVPFKALDSVVDALCRYLGSLPAIEAAEVLPKDIHALSQLFPVLRRVDVVRTARRRGALAPEPRMQRRQAIFALKELLSRIATRQRLLLFIDDLQWGDIDSARVLAELMSGRERPPMLIVCTYRSADKDPSPCLSTLLELMRGQHQGSVREISVGALPDSDCVDLARLLLQPTAQAQAPAVARESRGNPYLLAQLVEHVHSESEFESGIRVSLEHTLAERFATLSPEATPVLEVVAVSGRPLREQIVAELMPPGFDLVGALGELRRAKLVRGVGEGGSRAVAIYHESLRDAVLSRMAPSAIEGWHRRLAAAIERSNPIDLEALIEHLIGSRDQARAGIYAISAARRAFETLAFNKAAELYAIAVANLEDDAWRQELRLAHAEALVSAGRSTRAAEVYLEAAACAPEREAPRLRLRAGTQLMVTGSVERAVEALTPALAELGIRFPASDEEALELARPLFNQLRARGFDFVRRNESDLSKEVVNRLDALWGVIQATFTTRPMLAHPFAARHLLEALDAGEKTRIVCGLCAYFVSVDLAYSNADGNKPKSLQQAELLSRDLSDPRCRAWLAMARAFAFQDEGLIKPASLDFAQAEELFRTRCQNVAPEMRSCRLLYARALVMLGQFDELGVCEQWIREALECEDMLVATRLRLYCIPRMLLEDDVAQAQRTLDLPDGLTADGVGLTKLFRLLAGAQLSLYCGDGAELERIATEMIAVRRSPLLGIRAWRSEFLLGLARALIGACAVAADREAVLASAEQALAKAEKLSLECHADHARLLRAALYFLRGEPDRARAAIDAILDDADTGGDGRLVLACARIRRAKLEPGHAADALLREGQHELALRGVKEPLKFVRLYAPGFD
jgi:eukaryotic-like serine/threonine-protein kinase